MYSKKQWGGAIDPFILVTFLKDDSPPDRTVSLIIFEYRDKGLLGKPIGDDVDQVRQCDSRGRQRLKRSTAYVNSSVCIENIYMRRIRRPSTALQWNACRRIPPL
jgi:hypothetical protein